jgi:hypothetical protein
MHMHITKAGNDNIFRRIESTQVNGRKTVHNRNTDTIGTSTGQDIGVFLLHCHNIAPFVWTELLKLSQDIIPRRPTKVNGNSAQISVGNRGWIGGNERNVWRISIDMGGRFAIIKP